MKFNVGDRVFYTRTGEYGKVTEVDYSYDQPIIAKRDGSKLNMCYYPDGKLFEYDEEPAIILVDGNEKEIEKIKIKIRISKLEYSMSKIKELIEENKEYPYLLDYLEEVKDQFYNEIMIQKELCDKIK